MRWMRPFDLRTPATTNRVVAHMARLVSSSCAALSAPILWSLLAGESFLSHTQRLPAAELLVVEGWIGREGVRAAATEFREHGYKYVATSGGPTLGRWERERSNYAEMAGLELVALGVPRDKIIVAPCRNSESRRTFESAAAVLARVGGGALAAKGAQRVHLRSARETKSSRLRQGFRRRNRCGRDHLETT